MALNRVEIDRAKAEEWVNLLRSNDSKTLNALYKKTYPMVEKYVLQNKGNSEDAKDIFQDAFYLLIGKTKEDGFTFTAQPSTFLFGISKNLWLKQLTKKNLDLNEFQHEQNHSESHYDEDEDWQKLQRVKKMKTCLNALGEPCKTILEQFYFLQTSMKKIAALLHYQNPEHAKNQKYKCLIRLKKIVQTHKN